MTKKKIVLTKNKEIFNKLKQLNFIDEIILRNANNHQISKILNNVNRKNKILKKENIGDYIIIKKISPLNFNVYFTGKK